MAVRSLVGTPTKVVEAEGLTARRWVYEGVTVDEVSGTIDPFTAVEFENGLSGRVKFYLKSPVERAAEPSRP